jgi:hypothetical protein
MEKELTCLFSRVLVNLSLSRLVEIVVVLGLDGE